MNTGHQLAQVNVALLKAPLDSPELADFVAWLDPINAIADGAPGFVWRLQSDAGNATNLRIFDSDALIVNMSVWESVEALSDYVYRSAHAGVLRRRREWFAKMTEAHVAMWWVPLGTRPTIADAEERLIHLRMHGPTATAFTLKQTFDPPTTPAPAPQPDRPSLDASH